MSKVEDMGIYSNWLNSRNENTAPIEVFGYLDMRKEYLEKSKELSNLMEKHNKPLSSAINSLSVPENKMAVIASGVNPVTMEM